MIYKHKVITAFNKAVVSYETHAILQKNVARHLALLLNEYPSPSSILEIGCGTGFLTQHLLKRYPSTPYTASDISPLMVECCEKQISVSKHNYLQFKILDGEELLDKKYDWIVSSLTFQWFENLFQSIQKIFEKTNLLAFTIFLEGSLKEWEDFCIKQDLKPSTHTFPSKESLETCIKDLTHNKHYLYEEEIEQEFKSPLEFVQMLKNIGAHTPKHQGPFMNLKKTPPAKPFIISYKTAYVILQKG